MSDIERRPIERSDFVRALCLLQALRSYALDGSFELWEVLRDLHGEVGPQALGGDRFRTSDTTDAFVATEETNAAFMLEALERGDLVMPVVPTSGLRACANPTCPGRLAEYDYCPRCKFERSWGGDGDA